MATPLREWVGLHPDTGDYYKRLLRRSRAELPPIRERVISLLITAVAGVASFLTGGAVIGAAVTAGLLVLIVLFGVLRATANAAVELDEQGVREIEELRDARAKLESAVERANWGHNVRAHLGVLRAILLQATDAKVVRSSLELAARQCGEWPQIPERLLELAADFDASDSSDLRDRVKPLLREVENLRTVQADPEIRP